MIIYYYIFQIEIDMSRDYFLLQIDVLPDIFCMFLIHHIFTDTRI